MKKRRLSILSFAIILLFSFLLAKMVFAYTLSNPNYFYNCNPGPGNIYTVIYNGQTILTSIFPADCNSMSNYMNLLGINQYNVKSIEDLNWHDAAGYADDCRAPSAAEISASNLEGNFYVLKSIVPCPEDKYFNYCIKVEKLPQLASDRTHCGTPYGSSFEWLVNLYGITNLDLTCGNGIINNGEECDPADNSNPSQISLFNQVHCLTPGTTNQCKCSTDYVGTGDGNCINVCGNGIINNGEECDPASSSNSNQLQLFDKVYCSRPEQADQCHCVFGYKFVSSPDATPGECVLMDTPECTGVGDSQQGCVTGGEQSKECTAIGTSSAIKLTITSGGIFVDCSLSVCGKNFTVDQVRLINNFGETIASQNNQKASFNLDYLLYNNGAPRSLDSLGSLKCIFDLKENTKDVADSCSSQTSWLYDFDKDGYATDRQLENITCSALSGDCDDTPPSINPSKDENNFNYGFDKTCWDGWGNFMSANNKEAFCYADSNNEGVGDFATCSYCKNPGMTEQADDIDNNCKGTCQGDPSKTCIISGYLGDGANDPNSKGCGDVINKWKIKDTFCQMVDDNIKAKIDTGSIINCNGYNRAVKAGQFIQKVCIDYSCSSFKDSSEWDRFFTDLDISSKAWFNFRQVDGIKGLFFKPGGISWQDLGLPKETSNFFVKDFKSNLDKDFRKENAMLGYFGIYMRAADSKLSSDEEKKSTEKIFIEPTSNDDLLYDKLVFSAFLQYQKDFYSLNNKEGSGQITRDTADLPDQYIDSFRAEFNKKMGSSGKTLFDEFWKQHKYEIQDPKNNFQWQTYCVPKDKCVDTGDNNGPIDIYSVQPFRGIFKDIAGVDVNGEQVFNGHLILPVSLTDVDDPSCKFDNNGESAMANNYNNVDDASRTGSSPISVTSRVLPSDSYKKDPFRPNPYCKDKDGDGFCGCTLGSNGLCILDYTGMFTNGTIPSRQFPDCVDEISISPSTINSVDANYFKSKLGLNIKANTATGFGKLNENIAPWHIHPFTPITPSTCHIFSSESITPFSTTGFDLNCNKNGLQGIDYGSLVYGGTPFDYDLSTGMEIPEQIEYQTLVKAGSIIIVNPWKTLDISADLQCSLRPTGEDAVKISVGVAGAAISIAAFASVIPAFTSMASTSLYGLLGIPTAATEGVITSIFSVTTFWGAGSSAFSLSNTVKNWNSLSPADRYLSIINDAPGIAFGLMMLKPQYGVFKSSTKIGMKLLNGGKNGQAWTVEKTGADTKGQTLNIESRAAKDAITSSEVAPPKVACFLANTSIALANGSFANIQDIKAEENVLAYDLENKKSVSAEVTQTFVYNTNKYIKITYD